MLNRAEIIGHLGQNPKIIAIQNGEQRVASLSVTTTDRAYTRKDGTQVPEQTEWHNVVCFGKLADVAQQYLHKGSKVYVAGKMRTRSYEDKLGVKRYVTEIVVDELEMLGKAQQPASANNAQTATTMSPDDLREMARQQELQLQQPAEGNDLPF